LNAAPPLRNAVPVKEAAVLGTELIKLGPDAKAVKGTGLGLAVIIPAPVLTAVLARLETVPGSRPRNLVPD